MAEVEDIILVARNAVDPSGGTISNAISYAHLTRQEPLAELFTPGAGVDEPRRWLGLDLIRTAAMLLVLFGHVTFRMPQTTRPYHLLFDIRNMGLIGVDLFYVLSGFFIGGLLLTEFQRKGSINIGRFLIRRAWRLLPLYYLAVLWGWRWYHLHPFSVEDGHPVTPVAFWQMWPFLTFVQNYYNVADHNFGAGAVMQTWTVASLIHFYVIIALLLGVLSMAGKNALRALPWIVLLTFGACFALRLHSAPIDTKGYDAWKSYFPTHLRLDEPMFGVLLAYWVVNCRPQLERFMRVAWPMIVIAAIAMMLPIALRKKEEPRFVFVWGYTVAAVGGGALMLTAWYLENRRININARPIPGRPILKAISYIGIWSYSIYLWHQPLCQYLGLRVRNVIGTHIVKWASPFHYLAVVAVYLAMSIGLGAVMYYVLEKPLQSLRRKFTLKTPAPIAPTNQSRQSNSYPSTSPAISMTR
jgi:peptidoglycan/LPS O-acetylase OafA/YrhL